MCVVPKLLDRAPNYAAPLALDEVLQNIVEAFSAAGDATPIMVGAHYVSGDGHIGAPPCVIFVDVTEELAEPYELGHVAKDAHKCDVILRASEPGDDIGRMRNVRILSDRVVTLLRRYCAGKLELGKASKEYPSPFSVDSGAGVQRTWGFSYDRDIRADETMWAKIAPTPDDTTDPRPLVPPGAIGTLDTIDGATVDATET